METDEDVRALAVFMEAIEQAQAMDRQKVRHIAAAQFHNERIVDQVIAALGKISTVRTETYGNTDN